MKESVKVALMMTLSPDTTYSQRTSKTTSPSLLPPPGTLTLCVLTMATAIAQSIWGVGRVAQAVGVDVGNLLNPFSLIRIGEGQVIPGALALFAYVFPHGGWWHVLPHMTALWVFGMIAELRWALGRFVATYFASGAVGAFCYRLVLPLSTQPLAGASLAIAGLVGAYTARRWSGGSHPASHRRVVFLLEVVLAAGVVTWLTVRVAPSTPDLLSSVMYHFIPFFGMWLGVRVHGALKRYRTQNS